MTYDILMIGVSMVVLAINCTTMILTFPGKRGLPFTIAALVLFTAAFYSCLRILGIIVPNNGGLLGLVYLPIMILLFEGKFLHKVFAYFLQFLLTVFQVLLAEVVDSLFMRHSNVAFTVFPITLALLLTAYVILMFKFGRRVFDKLFVHGRTSEWLLYSFGAVFAFTVLMVTKIAPGSLPHITLILFFILWSFVVLCFAIINAHEKSKQKYEADFARDVISSGRDHYQKMNEMHDKLRILRHDYKFHLNSIHELFRSGDAAGFEEYMTGLETRLYESELPNYCPNPVINSLLISYAERCAKLDIHMDIQISIPDTLTIPNYDMCIVLGNLIENAVHACEQKNCEKKIEVILNTQGAYIAVMVKNSFNGEVIQEDGCFQSLKKDGGLGLRSVEAVAGRYSGELMTEFDGETFAAFVLMRV